MNPWIPIIAQYGLDFAIQLAALLKQNPEPTVEAFQNLKLKYGTKTEQQYVDEAGLPFVVGKI